MAVKHRIKVRGADELGNFLKSMQAEVAIKRVQAWMHVAGQTIVNDARSRYGTLSHVYNGRERASSGSLKMATRSWNSRKRISKRSFVRGSATLKKYAAIVHIGPKRDSREALARYWQHYYSGRRLQRRLSGSVKAGISHGHLVEWGNVRGAPEQKILSKATITNAQSYSSRLGAIARVQMRKSIQRQARMNRAKA